MDRIKAKKVKQGHTLTGLGYVIDVETNEGGYLTYPGYSPYTAALSSEAILITMNDDQGDEVYLVLPSGDSMVTVDSTTANWVG